MLALLVLLVLTQAPGVAFATTERVPFELRHGIIAVPATVRAVGGTSVSGLLVFDTGAPGLVLTDRAWDALQQRTAGESKKDRSFFGYKAITELEMGEVTLARPLVMSVAPERLLDPDVIGLFPPSVFADGAVVVDYGEERLTIVRRSLTVLSRDSAAAPGASAGSRARVARSKARFADGLGSRSIPVPFQLFAGGRMLVSVRIEDAARAWRSAPLSLLLDTGASGCVLFDDAIRDHVPHLRSWPRIEGIRVRTMLGTARADIALLPALTLTAALPPVTEALVETGAQARSSLPDLQGELPDKVDGLLGYTFLGRFRVTIDYANQVLWLEPTRTPKASEARPGTGLRLEAWGGFVRVLEVREGSMAAKAGLAYGDIVVAIDGERAADMSGADAEKRVAGKTGTMVRVVVRRGSMERVIELSR